MTGLGHESPCPACQTDGESALESGHLPTNWPGMSALPPKTEVRRRSAERLFCAIADI